MKNSDEDAKHITNNEARQCKTIWEKGRVLKNF